MSTSFKDDLKHSLTALESSVGAEIGSDRLHKCAQKLAEQYDSLGDSGMSRQLQHVATDFERFCAQVDNSLFNRRFVETEENVSKLFVSHKSLISDTAVMNLIDLRRESGKRNYSGACKAWHALSKSLEPLIILIRSISSK